MGPKLSQLLQSAVTAIAVPHHLATDRQRVSHRYAHKRTFPYSGTIDRVVIEPGPQAPGSIINSIEANIHRQRD